MNNIISCATFSWLICLWFQLGNSVFGQGTLVAPNGFGNVEGNGGVIALFGGANNLRTQMIYSSQQFSSLPAGGVYITELRYRMNGNYVNSFTGFADLDVKLSTSTQNPDALNANMDLNVGADEIVALPRSTITLFENATTPGGPHAFSVVIPLPNKFYYNPANGNLLVDAFVYSAGNLLNLDWHAVQGDGLSSALSGVVGPTANIPVTQFVFEPIPEPSSWAFLVFGGALLFLRTRSGSSSED